MSDQEKAVFPEMGDTAHGKPLGWSHHNLAAKLIGGLGREKQFEKEPELTTQNNNRGTNPT